MKILFIGGNGNISWWCVQRAIEKGYDVWELNRGLTRKTRKSVQSEVHQIICDVHNTVEMKDVLKDKYFDVVCDFISYNGEQAGQMVELFFNKTSQYIVISSEAVFRRQEGAIPFTEDSEQYNLEEICSCSYIKGKIEVENVYNAAYKNINFPITIVRPGYTYDIIIPTPAGGTCFTAIQKMIEGKPMIMYGDGNNLCAPMHAKDFSRYFIELCGEKNAIGESFNIVGQELLSWNKMEQYVMEAFHVERNGMIHISSEYIKNYEIFQYDELLKQHMCDYLFDCNKIKKFVKNQKENILFRDGIQETADLLMSHSNYRRIDPKIDAQLSEIYKLYERGTV